MRIAAAIIGLSLSGCISAGTIIRHQNGVAAVETIGAMEDVTVMANGDVKIAKISSPLDSVSRTLNLGMVGALFGL